MSDDNAPYQGGLMAAEHKVIDDTEATRRQMVADINSNPSDREVLEGREGTVWDTSEMQKDFIVEGFGAPFVVVTRKSDNVRGSLEFQHSPRFYYNFQPA